jgi:Uma2 family endonuclease
MTWTELASCYANGMPSRLHVAPGDYLSMSFEGLDREYVRGEIVERGIPDYPHGRMQAELGFRFETFRDSHELFACSETRMKLAPDLYRIPDVAVFADLEPSEPVPSLPPMVVIEIISPDDRYSEVLEKLAEYQRWGVQHIWVVDPHRRTLAAYRSAALVLESRLILPGYPLELSGDIFGS